MAENPVCCEIVSEKALTKINKKEL